LEESTSRKIEKETEREKERKREQVLWLILGLKSTMIPQNHLLRW